MASSRARKGPRPENPLSFEFNMDGDFFQRAIPETFFRKAKKVQYRHHRSTLRHQQADGSHGHREDVIPIDATFRQFMSVHAFMRSAWGQDR